jgi:hypothetical protein
MQYQQGDEVNSEISFRRVFPAGQALQSVSGGSAWMLCAAARVLRHTRFFLPQQKTAAGRAAKSETTEFDT